MALRLESGMNDVVLLPIVLVGILALQSRRRHGPARVRPRTRSGSSSSGPGPALLVGFVAITLLEKVRSRVGVRRDYESLYALGVAFTAFAAAEAVHGSGFLAAFAAGIAVAAHGRGAVRLLPRVRRDHRRDDPAVHLRGVRRLADLERLLAWPTAARCCSRCSRSRPGPLVLLPVLAQAGVAPRSRRLIAWFGPRGLSSLLLVLLPVFAGMPGSERLFAITCLVVLLSVLLHGAAIAVFLRKDAGPGPAVATGPARPPKAEPATPEAPVPERITLAEMRELQDAGELGGAGRREDRPHLSNRYPQGQGGRPPSAGRRSAQRPQARARSARHGGALLCLKGRSHKRPGGARAQNRRLAQGPRPGGWLGGLEEGRPAGRAQELEAIGYGLLAIGYALLLEPSRADVS